MSFVLCKTLNLFLLKIIFFSQFLGCEQVLSVANGSISSPAFGLSPYPSNQECTYLIKRPKGGPLSLKFTSFDLDDADFVQVWLKLFMRRLTHGHFGHVKLTLCMHTYWKKLVTWGSVIDIDIRTATLPVPVCSYNNNRLVNILLTILKLTKKMNEADRERTIKGNKVVNLMDWKIGER